MSNSLMPASRFSTTNCNIIAPVIIAISVIGKAENPNLSAVSLPVPSIIEEVERSFLEDPFG
ncbi:MAG: hypothetical protein LLF92_09460 [Planctomycetaceae bacterium]|nr:hypothetical protein [Planctomycetaceae bacterium]